MDTELLTDEGGVLSLAVVLRPAITTILFHPSLNSSSSQVTIDQHHCHHHHHHHHFRPSNNLKFFLALSLGLLGLAGRPLLGPVGQLRRTCARPSLVCEALRSKPNYLVAYLFHYHGVNKYAACITEVHV